MPQRIQRAATQAQQAVQQIQQLSGQIGQTQFGGAQAMFQPGFAGTNAQQVRQQNAQASWNQGGMMNQGGFAGGTQSMFQPGFAGTDAQKVRQEIAQDISYLNQGGQRSFQSSMGSQGYQGGMGSQGGWQGGIGSQGGFTGGAQSIMQPGFAGTDAQKVRQEIAQDTSYLNQGGLGSQSGWQGGFGNVGGITGGAQAMLQPSFAGTDAQRVRQEIAQDTSYLNQGNMGSQGGYQNSLGSQGIGSLGYQSSIGNMGGMSGGAQSMMQPGFAGTNPQQIRQEIAQDAGYLNQGMQNSLGMQSGFQGNMSNLGGFTGGAQSIMQPGFAGTDAQKVRQEIAQDTSYLNQGNMGSQGGYQNSLGSQGIGSLGYQSSIGNMGGMSGGAQSMMQPGFAGTNPQQIRQEIAQDAGYLNQGMQNSLGMQSGFQGNMSTLGGFSGGAQSIMQPGFAGTDAQQVRQDISRETGGLGLSALR